MALIKCTECGSDVSTKAEACPKCGAKPTKPMGVGAWIMIMLVGFVALSIIVSNKTTPETPAPSTTTPAQETAAVTPDVPTPYVSPAEPPVPAPPEVGAQWSYNQYPDKMTSGVSYVASVESTNTVNFDFPYNGEQHARLSLRTNPRHGKDVIFKIEKGQILCHAYDDDCRVLVRFDEQTAATYSASPPADNSTETIFINNYARFMEKLQIAKLVRISTNIYQQGQPVFEFDVSGFSKEKYKPGK